MKKFFASILVLLLAIGVLFAFTACDTKETDDSLPLEEIKPGNPIIPATPIEPATPIPPEKPDDKPSGGSSAFSPEVMEKIMKIYGAATTGPQEVNDVHTLAILTSISQTIQEHPISVTPATLNGEDITLVTIGGTEFKQGQATGIKESALGSMGKNNDYLKNVVKLFNDGVVPKDKPVLVTGISLGGIIAQQILDTRYSNIINEYDIKGIVCFGAPFAPPLVTKGTNRNTDGVKIVRFTDSNDMVPKSVVSDGSMQGDFMEQYIQKNFIKTPADRALMEERNECEILLETGTVTDGLAAHALSYISEPCWDKYDFMGDKAGTNHLVLKEKMTFYPAPKLGK